MRQLLEQANVAAVSRDYNSGTALPYTAENGHEKVEADSRDNTGRIQLSHAAEKVSCMVLPLVKQDNVAADSRDDHGRTSLSYAKEDKQSKIVDAFLFE